MIFMPKKKVPTIRKSKNSKKQKTKRLDNVNISINLKKNKVETRTRKIDMNNTTNVSPMHFN